MTSVQFLNEWFLWIGWFKNRIELVQKTSLYYIYMYILISDQIPQSVSNTTLNAFVWTSWDGLRACRPNLKPCHLWASSGGFKCFWGERGGAQEHAGGLHELLKSQWSKNTLIPMSPSGHWAKGAAPSHFSLFLTLSFSFWFLLVLKNSRRCGRADRCITAYC